MEISSDLKEKHETFQEEGYVRGGIMSLLQLGPFPASPLSLAGLLVRRGYLIVYQLSKTA